jgi:hypothetical protein
VATNPVAPVPGGKPPVLTQDEAREFLEKIGVSDVKGCEIER